MLKKYLHILVLLIVQCIVYSLAAQIGIGHWRDHLPYNQAFRIALTPNHSYAATPNAIYSYHRKTGELEKLSRVHGLSDMGISAFEYIPDRKLLFVGYDNGNIDLISDNQIFNMPDIKRYAQITANKGIRHLLAIGPLAYLSTGFGIVVVDLERREIRDTYFIGPQGNPTEVFCSTSDGICLYASTPAGILKAPKDDPNLINFAVWQNMNDLPAPDAIYPHIGFFGNSMVLVRNNGPADAVYYQGSTGWNLLLEGEDVLQLRQSDNLLMVITSEGVRIYDSSFNLTSHLQGYSFGQSAARDALADKESNIWIADHSFGMVKVTPSGTAEAYRPDGPFTPDIGHIAALRGKVYVAGGGVDAAWNGIFKPGILYSFIEEDWKSNINYSVRDITRLLIDPDDPSRLFAASWGYGVLEYHNGELVNVYNESNSSLQSIIPGSDFVRVGGLAFDREKNLWVTNTGVAGPVSVKTANGWFSLDYKIDAPTLGQIMVNRWEHKWIILPRGSGLFAFDNMNSIENTDDDQTKKFGLQDENGNTITNDVFSMAEDRDGNIWVGSSKGPVVYYNPQNVFSGDNFYASRIKIPADIPGQANYLLESETITAIAIDGANRKWLGTLSSGVYLLSADGTREIHHFTAENSPLFSNNIVSLAVDDKTGEVFFGTDKGIVSFRGTATGPAGYFSQVYVFPNPVREGYEGPVTVTGLVDNTYVKITDISGNLVFETRSLGGQAVWDGRNLNGNRVRTGVYLVFLTNSDGSQTHITKLLFVH